MIRARLAMIGVVGTLALSRAGWADSSRSETVVVVGTEYVFSLNHLKAAALPPPRVHPAWVMSKLERLDDLLRRDPQRAKVEILKHLDGDLVIAPRPSLSGERRAEISGHAKSDSLGPQEAVCLQVVREAGPPMGRALACSARHSPIPSPSPSPARPACPSLDTWWSPWRGAREPARVRPCVRRVCRDQGDSGRCGAQGQLTGERQRLEVVALSPRGSRSRRGVTSEAQDVRFACASAESAGESQGLLGVAGCLVDPASPKTGKPRPQKNERRPAVNLPTTELCDGPLRQRQRLVEPTAEGVGAAENRRDVRDQNHELPCSGETVAALESPDRGLKVPATEVGQTEVK